MKIVRYFFVGGIAAAVDITIFFVFAKLFGFNYLTVGACGFVIATLVNYVLSIRYVFESGARFEKKYELMFVYIVSILGLLWHQAVLYACVDVLKIELMLSKLIATATVFFWNYGSRRYWIFQAAR
jgi:putative flippase GtrA